MYNELAMELTWAASVILNLPIRRATRHLEKDSDMNRILLVLWAYAVAWTCAGLIHTTDADVGGLQGLLTPAVLVSVSLFGLAIAVPILLCQFILVRHRWRGFAIAVVGSALPMGLIVAALGSTAETTSQWLGSFLGIAGLFGLVLLVGAAPAFWFGSVGNQPARATET